MMWTRFTFFLLYFITWLILSWSFNPVNLAIGAFISALILFLTSGVLEKKTVGSHKNFKRYLWFLYYIPLFIWECFKANLDGAYRVIHPDLPMRPGIVKVRTNLKSDSGLTFLANTITLKPGTMTVDIDRENGFLYVHWVNVESQDIEKATKIIVEKFEKVLMRIFE